MKIGKYRATDMLLPYCIVDEQNVVLFEFATLEQARLALAHLLSLKESAA